MVIKSAAAVNSSVPTACSHCGMGHQLQLHNVRHRDSFRRLCTTCVLRLHPLSFCPTCFHVYPPPPPNGAVLTCTRCGSASHSHCVAAPPNPYICPLCINPAARIFKSTAARKGNADGLSVSDEEGRVMDRESAKKLLAAAKIVSASWNKAAAAAKAEAERRAREAAFTRKRAREALELVAHLAMKEKLRKKEEALMASRGPRNGFGKGYEKMDDLDAGEIVDWSDVSDIEQMLFSDEEKETGANNLD